VREDFAAAHPGLRPGPHVRLTVRDTGHGIPPVILDRIFDPFFTTKDVGEGTGMGLAVVHGIVASHGGAIAVASTPRHGTTFEIYLPRINHPLHAQITADEPIPHGHERLLFIDDEPALARLVQEILEQLGYDVMVHTSSVGALETFRMAPQHFDLVITDQTMPHLTGEALSRQIRKLRPDIPIILCTGFSYTMTMEKASALGIQAFLMKPLVTRDLALTVRRVLDQQRGV
jgi:CheY-like chemotaxis protein